MATTDMSTPTSGVTKAARGVVATVATLGAIAVVGDFQTWEEFLWWASGSVGAGALIFLIIQGIEKLKKGNPIPSTIKFYVSLVLGFTIPIGAYLGLVYWLGVVPFDRNQMLAAIIAGFRTASTIHWEGERMEIEREQDAVIAKRLSAFEGPDAPSQGGMG